MTEKIGTIPACQTHSSRRTKKMLHEKSVADELAVSVGVLRKWRANGTGPVFCRMNGCIRYPLDGVEAFIEESKCRFTGEASNRNRAILAQPVNWKG